VAVLLLAALVAVPLLLSADPEPVPPAPSSAADEAAELAAQPLVAVASASERESARRVLGARKDPFKPTNQPKRKRRDSVKTSAESGVGSAGSDAAPTADAQTGTGGSTYVAPAPLPSGSEPDPSAKRASHAAGSLSVRRGQAGDEQLERLEVERLDPLPTPDEPLLVYLGLTADGQSAVFMLDAGVTVEGDGRCRPNPEDCQSVELTAGET
jgi:hypothetical protein